LVVEVVSRQCEVELEKSLLALTEIESSSDYKSKEETSTGSALPLYISLPLIPLPQLSLPTSTDSPSFYYNISQHGSINYKQIIRQQQEWLVAMQA